MIAFSLSANAEETQKNGKFNISLKNISIEDAIEHVEEQCDYTFLFSGTSIDTKGKVSLEVKEGTIDDIVKQIVNGRDIVYSVVKNRVILTSAKIKQQEKKINIKGKVVDGSGESIPGVNVQVEGTNAGVVTDSEGNYSISVNSEATHLIFSFVGMEKQRVAISSRSVVDVVMEDTFSDLQEVVVIGYGTKTKGALTGSTHTLKAKEITSRPQTELVQSLQGAIPGLMITRGDGRVGYEDNKIELRGVTSTNKPGVLIIIDGIPQRETNANALNSVNPQDIENITVLKDAQAAIYGARAAGGVILITTKNGKENRPVINYESNYSWNVPMDMAKPTNIKQHMLMADEAFRNDGNNNHFFKEVVKHVKDPSFDINNPQVVKGPFGDTPTIWLGHNDWVKEMWGTAFMQKHHLSISGKTNKSNYFVSAGILDQNSMLQHGSNYNLRYFTRLKYDFTVFKDLLTIGTNISLERQKIKEPYAYNTIKGNIASAWTSMPLYTPKGNYYNFGGFLPPHAFANGSGDKHDIFYRTRMQFNFKLTPLKDLTIEGNYATNLDINDYSWQRKIIQFHNWDETPSSRSTTKNGAGSYYRRDVHQVANLFATYKKSIDKHNASIVIGSSHEEIDNRSFDAARDNIISDELPILDLGDPEMQHTNEMKSQYAIQSYFGRFSYDYNQKYMIEANYRRDGSSRFHEDYRWGDFYGVSAAWALSKEEFISNLNIFDNLKLRASYGELGNQYNVGRFDHFSRIKITGQLPYGDPLKPTKTQYAHEESPLASKNRTWETVKMKNFAVDFAVLDSRLSGSIDYFIKNTEDILISQEFPTTLGIAPPKVNGGEIETKGWEFTLNWKDKIGEVDYFVSVNYFDNKNKVVSLEDSKVVTFGYNQYREGYSTGSYFGLEYGGLITDQAELDEYKKKTGVPGNLRLGDVMWIDKDGDGVIEKGKLYKEGDPDSGDLVCLGNNNIRHQYSFTAGASWKGIDFSVMFQGVGEWKVMNNTSPMGGAWWVQPWDYEYNKTWNPDRTDASWPRMTSNGGIDGWNWQTSDASYKMYNNSYIRLKNLQIGYTIPNELLKKFSVTKLRVYFSGSDLWESHNLPEGFNPEKPFAFSYTPMPRYYSLGFNLTF